MAIKNICIKNINSKILLEFIYIIADSIDDKKIKICSGVKKNLTQL